jgi:proline dehydrogenase
VQGLIPDAKYFDYEMLYGIRRDLQKSLQDRGYRVRVYIPFGKDWLPYTLRRLGEWKNLKFVAKNVFKEWFK